jgi:hypothetical protein
MPRTGTSSVSASSRSSLLQAAVYGYLHPGESSVCQPALGVTSIVPKPVRVAHNVVLEGQPFIVTGDTIFTVVDLGGGAESVQV